jgi:hypothetical protein
VEIYVECNVIRQNATARSGQQLPEHEGEKAHRYSSFRFNDPQNAITGQVLIANNMIENLGADFANGMQVDSVAAAWGRFGFRVVIVLPASLHGRQREHDRPWTYKS